LKVNFKAMFWVIIVFAGVVAEECAAPDETFRRELLSLEILRTRSSTLSQGSAQGGACPSSWANISLNHPFE